MSFESSDCTCMLNFQVFVCFQIKFSIKINAKKGEPTSFIFTSNNLSTADYLMIIIHGTGVVRAGQWSRK